jgi:hypothetical protein
MEPEVYPSEGGPFFYVYYKMEEGQWVIVAVHPEGERRPHPYTPRTVVEAVDELGAFQKVNTWLQKANAVLSKMTPAL